LKTTIRILLLLALTQTAVSFAANRDIVELQRDLALLQHDVQLLQRSLERGLGGTKELAQQTLHRVDQIHSAEVVRNENFAKNWEKLNLAIATLTVRLDQNTAEYLATREAIAGLSTKLARLEQKVLDVTTWRSEQQSSTRLSPLEVLDGPPSGMTAQSLFEAAMRDKLAGHFDLALDEFGQYLRYYGDTDLAASSQFHIGEIHYHRGELPAADEAFGAVIERYPNSSKAADALLMRALVRENQGESAAASDDLNRLLKAYRGSDAAKRAATQLKRMKRAAEIATGRSR
jgi:TolA-binding protein